MIIWPVMIYGIIAWHQPWDQHGLNQRLNEVLAPFQNQGLWIITEAYQVTPAYILEAGAHVPLLNPYLNSIMTQTIQHLEDGGVTVKIEWPCQKVC